MSYILMTRGTGGLSGFRGFGATSTFSGTTVWSDCQSGAAGNNAAGKRCGQSIQAGLNKLGYGPLTVDGQIGSGTIAAIKQFGIDNGFGAITWPTKAMVLKMQELLDAGAKPGPGAAVDSHVVGGEIVPGAAPGTGLAKLGLSTGALVGIGALVLVGVGALAIVAKKKKGSTSAASAH